MSRTTVSQIFSPNNAYIPTKASLFLRVAGQPSASFVIGNNLDAAIDAANYATIRQGPLAFTYADTLEGFTDSGYIQTVEPLSFIQSNDGAYVDYPIRSDDDGKYSLWLRIYAIKSYSLDIQLDGTTIATVSGNSSGGWIWIQSSFVLPDNERHILSLKVKTALTIDKLYITRSSSVPSGTGPDQTTSPFVTLHVRLGDASANQPLTYYTQEASKNTYDHLVKDGWYNFNLSVLDGFALESASQMAVTVNASGSTPIHFITWANAEIYANPIATRVDSGLWSVSNTESMAVRIYADLQQDEYGCTINTPDATIETDVINSFSTAPKMQKTNVVFVADSQGGEDVELDVASTLLTLVVDQSGSMTWNDSTGLRHQFSQGIVDALQARYPADIRFNLLAFRGEPCFSILVPLTTQVESNKISDIVKQHFKGDSSNFAGFRVVRRKDHYPETAIDGEIVMDGYGLAALDVNLEQNTDYYYKVFTYDQQPVGSEPHYSAGVEIPVTTRPLSLPRGMPNIKSRVLKGYDLQLDINTVALWNMDEGDGDYVYDFGTSETTLESYKTRWINPFDCPAGVNGQRFNGIDSYLRSNVTSELSVAASADATFMGWVYPLSSSTAKQPLLIRSGGGKVNYAIVLDGLTLKLCLGNTSVSCSNTIPLETWSHWAVTYSNGVVRFYINGQFVNQTSISTDATFGSSDMPLSVGQDPAGVWNGVFFGKLSHLSIHNVVRTDSFISAAAKPVKIFDSNNNQIPLDNGDRVVVLDYVIPDDANYDEFRIVRKVDSPPRYETDGDVVLSGSTSPGRYSFGASALYDVAHTYYFRVFTQNAVGAWSPIEDSTLLGVDIPDIDRPSKTYTDYLLNQITVVPGPGKNTSLPTPTVTVQRAGNEKTWIKWAAFSDPDVTRVKIYYSDQKFPVYNAQTQSIEGGAIVFDADTSKSEFVHRNLPNRITAYYVIVSCNRFQQFSELVYVSLQPLSDRDDSGIPLLEAQNVHYHLVDYDRVQITWDSPVSISSSLSAYFDDKFYVYAAICDLYGNPIPIDYPESVKITSSITNKVATSVEDVFNLNASLSDADRLPRVAFSVNTNGIVSGVIRLRPSTLFSVLESISIGVSAEYDYSDDFTYTFPTGTLTFNNPLSLELLNRDSLYLSTNDFVKDGCDVSDESGGTGEPNSYTRQRVNGTYIRRKTPFAIRAQYTYKGLPIAKASVAVKLFDATGGPCGIQPILTTTSKTLSTTSNAFGTQEATIPILDGYGNNTGYSENISYSDILVRPPQQPQSGSAYVRVNYNGFSVVRKIYMFYPTILKMSLTAASPKADGIDVREQFVRLWLIDPDNPYDNSKITLAPDNTVIKWTMLKGSSVQRTVPFYSTDNVPLTNGVYSFTRNGTARLVFFGPAQASAAGQYDLQISATVQGLIAQTDSKITIEARGGDGGFTHFIPDPDAPRILCEFENGINYLWADGVDYQKMTITRNPSDPSKSTTKYANNFRHCSDVLFPLPVGTVVTITAPGYEIISGVVEELVDANGKKHLNTDSAISSIDTADVKLGKDPYTYVYFRKNAEIDPISCHDVSVSNCVCFDLPDRVCAGTINIGTETGVVASTKINYFGKPLTIYGGGSYTNDGKPPCVLVPKEPLSIQLIGIFTGSPLTVSNTFVIDNVTTNTVFVEVRYADQPVPDNTEVKVELICNLTELNGVPIKTALNIPDYIYTTTTEEYPGGNPENNGGPFSLASLTIAPIPSNVSISFAVSFTTTYPYRPSLQTSSSSSGT